MYAIISVLFVYFSTTPNTASKSRKLRISQQSFLDKIEKINVLKFNWQKRSIADVRESLVFVAYRGW